MASIERGRPEAAVMKALDQLPGVGGADGDGGGIAIAKGGEIGRAHNSAHFVPVAYVASDRSATAFLKKDEDKGG